MRSPRTTLPIAILTAILAAMIGALSATPAARAASITTFEKDEASLLRLRDGRIVAGRFRTMLGSPKDSIGYSERYEGWRAMLGPRSAPALGETLVVSRRSAELRGAFRGFAGNALLLGTEDSCVHLLVRLDKHTQVRRAGDPDMDPDWNAARNQWKRAPSPYAFELKTSDGATAVVPATMVAERHLKPLTGGEVVRNAVVGVVVIGSLLCLAWLAAMSESFSGPFL